MGKNKLQKFAEIDQFENVYQHDKSMKGKWKSEAFGNDNPLTLELACGKGEYTIGQARMFPERNFMGLDIKGNRIWKGASIGVEENIPNAKFLRCKIHNITDYFEQGEVDEIWITFPDPQPRDSKEKHRLTHERFLRMYQEIGHPGMYMNVKTDSDLFYEYTLETIRSFGIEPEVNVDDVYAWHERPEYLNIRTFYESMWLDEGKKIKYLRFKLELPSQRI